MPRKLHAEDARIVDMLFDSGSFWTDGSVPQAFSHSPEMFNTHFAQVEKILKLLDEMPVMEPPSNLVASTMSFIEQSSQHHHQNPSAGTDAEQQPTA